MRQCSQVPLTFMSSLPQVSQSGKTFLELDNLQCLEIVSFLILIVQPQMHHKNVRDCLFPGGEEGAGGVLVAEEAFYQV